MTISSSIHQSLHILVWNGRGWYFSYVTLSFGWKASTYVYHTVGMAATHFIRSNVLSCSQYIDDRHAGQLHLPRACMNHFSNFQLVQMAAFVACLILISLDYFIGLKKVSFRCVSLSGFWGYFCDSERISFASKRISLKNLQSSQGRPPHFSCWFLRQNYTPIACFKPLPRPLERASCKLISPHLCIRKFHIM